MLQKEQEKIEVEMETTIRDALKAGKVPMECIEEVSMGDDFYVKVVVFHEA